MSDFPDAWQLPLAEELYVIEALWGDIVPLAQSFGIETERSHPVVWTHETEGDRVFASSLGHHSAMFEQPEFHNMVAHAVLWRWGELLMKSTITVNRRLIIYEE